MPWCCYQCVGVGVGVLSSLVLVPVCDGIDGMPPPRGFRPFPLQQPLTSHVTSSPEKYIWILYILYILYIYYIFYILYISIPSPTAAKVTRDLLPREIHLTIWTKTFLWYLVNSRSTVVFWEIQEKTLKCRFKGAAWVGTSDVLYFSVTWIWKYDDRHRHPNINIKEIIWLGDLLVSTNLLTLNLKAVGGEISSCWWYVSSYTNSISWQYKAICNIAIQVAPAGGQSNL